MKKILLSLAFLAFVSTASANQFNLGAQFQAWNSNFATPYNGWEFWAPLSLSFKLGQDFSFFALGKFGTASYTDSGIDGMTTTTVNLTAFTDTMAGGELKFKMFGLPSVLNLSFNIPSGDKSWESQQMLANIPTEFVASRYQSRGFGLNAYYGLSFSTGAGANLAVAAGYQYTGGYNPTEGITPIASDLNLGDALFLAVSHVQSGKDGAKDILRLSGYYFLTSQENGVDTFQMGPNLNLSYKWFNPKGFSLEVGGQGWLPARRLEGPVLATESNLSYAPRFFLNPSLALGVLTLSARTKYVMGNAYPVGHALYDAGGFLFGLEPSLWIGFDKESGLRLTASYDFVIDQAQGLDTFGNPVDVNYNRVTFGTRYEVKW